MKNTLQQFHFFQASGIGQCLGDLTIMPLAGFISRH
jgi:hypothetical protein